MIPSNIVRSLWRWRPGSYLRSSGGLFFWLAARAGMQVALVFSLTRLLTAEQYGSFVATLAVATLFTPLAGLGLYNVLVRDGSRDNAALPRLLRASLDLWWRAALLFGLIAVAIAKAILPPAISLVALAILVPGEIASTSLTELIARVEQARHHPKRYGAINAGLAAIRLATLGLCMIGHATLDTWAMAYALSSLSYAGALLIWAARTVTVSRSATPDWQMLKEGKPFLLALLSLRVQSEANKPILAHSGLAAAGNFNIAQRALDIAALPLNALQEVLAPRLFASSQPLRHAALPLAFIMAVSLIEALVLWYGAPLLPQLFGHGYANVSWLIRALILIPTAQAMRNVLGVALVALNCAGALTRSYIVSMTASIALNLLLIPRHGLHGAVIAAYVTEALTTVTLAAILFRLHFVRQGTSS